VPGKSVIKKSEYKFIVWEKCRNFWTCAIIVVKAEEEHKLIKNLIKGDADSFDDIFRRYHERIYAFSLVNLKNKEDSEGVVQEVFLNLWKDRTKLKEVKNLNAWVFKISFNVIRRRFRSVARERQQLRNYTEATLSDDGALDKDVEYNDLLAKADKIIDKLPNRQRTIWHMSKREGFSNTEISNKLNITKKTVENHLTRAKTFLKKSFIEDGILSILFFWLFIK